MSDENTTENTADISSPQIKAEVERIVSEQTAALKKNRDEVLAEKKKLSAEYDSLRQSLGGEEGLKNLLALQEKFANDEAMQLLAQGKTEEWFEKRVAPLKASHTKEKDALTVQLQEANQAKDQAIQQLHGYMISQAVSMACNETGVLPEFQDMVQSFIAPRIGISEDGKVFVKDEAGEIAYGPKGKAMTVAEAIDSYREKKGVMFAPSNGGGAAGGSRSSGSVKNPWLKGQVNRTEQMRIAKDNPQLAQQLKAEAG